MKSSSVEKDLGALGAEGGLVGFPASEPGEEVVPATGVDRFPAEGSTGEEIDRRTIGDELVGGRPPGEDLGGDGAGSEEQLDSGPVGTEAARFAGIGQDQ